MIKFMCDECGDEMDSKFNTIVKEDYFNSIYISLYSISSPRKERKFDKKVCIKCFNEMFDKITKILDGKK